MKPTLCVVIVTYDAPERLGTHISALLAQTHPPGGLIIVNNGKKDVNWAAEQVGGKFPVHIISCGNIGPAGGFNEGAKTAYEKRYDYVILCDDDAVPAERETLGYFYENAGKGLEVVAGYYTNGIPVTLSNHYYMIKREVFRKTGFYFEPFFLGSEDMEFHDRLRKAAGIYSDERIMIKHPNRMTTDSRRTYFFLRNFSVHMAISGSGRAYAYSFLTYFVRCSFIATMLGRPGFLRSFFRAMSDFFQCRLGNEDFMNEHLRLEEMAPSQLAGQKAIFVEIGGKKHQVPPAFSSANMESLDDIYSALMKGKPNARLIKMLLETNEKFYNRSVVLSNHFLLAFPPFSVTAKDIYVYEELEGRFWFLYKNSPLISLALTMILVPIGILLLPWGMGAFYLRKGRYRKMMQEMIDKDILFCKKADDAPAIGVKM